MNDMPYKKFMLMLAASFVIMYVVMYLNVELASHIYFSFTRFYMTVLMVTSMAVLMLLMMPKMYPNKKLNLVIIVSSCALFALSLAGVRSQTFISDRAYMRAMIPHHSIAILTSKNAHITDPEVRRLADSIIKAQEDEIAQMKKILTRMDNE